MAKFKCAVLFSVAVILFGFCGCATKGSSSSVSDLYELTVGFTNPKIQTIHKIQIDVRPEVSFAVRTVDEAGNHYEVSGTMHKRANGNFGFEAGKAFMQLAKGANLN